MASKKIAEAALKHAPKPDVERSLFLMDELYNVDGQRSRSHTSVEYEYQGTYVVSRRTIPPQSSTFIYCSRVIGFSKLVWHRTTKHKLLVAPRRSYLDRYAYIEAATNPSSLCIDNTDISIGEPQVVPDKCLNGLPLIPE